METKFNFKSQICTNRFQSERLLSLGLKKETADIEICCLDGEIRFLEEEDYQDTGITIPAWSLHRLLEMNLNSTDTRFEVRFNQLDVKDAYELLLAHIEWLIKEGYFNKEYLV